jgi:hypothetical protein
MALEKNGLSLEFASEELQQDKNTVIKAIEDKIEKNNIASTKYWQNFEKLKIKRLERLERELNEYKKRNTERKKQNKLREKQLEKIKNQEKQPKMQFLKTSLIPPKEMPCLIFHALPQ